MRNASPRSVLLVILLLAAGSLRPARAQAPAAPAAVGKAADAYARGLALQEKGRTEAAIQAFSEAIRLDPARSLYVSARGFAYLGTHSARAIADFTRAVELDPRNHEAFAGRAAAYVARKEYKRAVLDYTWALQIQPDDPAYHEARAFAHRRAGDLRGALADADRVVALQPKKGRAYALRAEIHADLKAFDQALNDLNQAVELAPAEDAGPLAQRASLYLSLALEKTGKEEKPLGARFRGARAEYQLALADVEKALARAPQNAQLKVLRMSLLLEMGNWERALDALGALQRESAAPAGDLMAVEGYCLLRLGRYPEALQRSREALTRRPGHAHACLTLALLYALRGEPDSSRKVLEIGLGKARPVDKEQYLADAEALLAREPDSAALQQAVTLLRAAVGRPDAPPAAKEKS